MAVMFNTDELTNFRAAQEAHMMDSGKRMAHSQTYNGYNEPVAAFTPAATEIKCGLEMKAGNEIDKNTMTQINYDAVLRLPIGTTINYMDRFQVTKQNGESITPITFEIVSPVQKGPSGIRVLLRKVET